MMFSKEKMGAEFLQIWFTFDDWYGNCSFGSLPFAHLPALFLEAYWIGEARIDPTENLLKKSIANWIGAFIVNAIR